MTAKVKYNRELLEQICERDKCIVDFEKIENYYYNTRIDFICCCGNIHNKSFTYLYKNSGGFCKICTEENRQNKVKITYLEKYGVEHNSQTQGYKDKYKQTCLERYGVENPNKSEEVKDKIKKTNIERFGVEYTLQSQDIREKGKQTYLFKYGVEHNSQTQEYKDKYKQTCLDKYGVEHPNKSEEVKDKIKNTNLERFGVEYPLQSQDIREKGKQTCLDKYGVENISQTQQYKDKYKQTCLDKYGVEHPLQFEDIRHKIKQTCIDKYGVEHPVQNAKIAEKQFKNSYKLKTFTFSCNNTIQVQGYEPFLLDILAKEGYIFDDIITKRTEVPEIWYNKDYKKCRYYCDVYIPKTNTIYEVKSTWTYKKDIEDIPLKKQACIDAGYNFELYVFNSKGIRQLMD